MLSTIFIYVLVKSLVCDTLCDDILLEEEVELIMDTYLPYLTNNELSRSAKMSTKHFEKLEKQGLKADPESKMKYIEGDMMMDKKELKQVMFVATKWPKGRIPYILETQFTPLERHAISRGIISIQKKTCIKFVPKQWFDNDYVHIIKGRGCGAHVGKRGGRQLINLGRGCFNSDTIIHELMHSIGFIHEQSRPDRDLYVNIHWNNIRPGREREFRKHRREYFYENGFPYDLLSVMHYREYAFSKNGLKTITPNKSIPHLRCRPNECPTDLDVNKINHLYECFAQDINNKRSSDTKSNTESYTNSNKNVYNIDKDSNTHENINSFAANNTTNNISNNTIKLSKTQIEVNAIQEVLNTLIPTDV